MELTDNQLAKAAVSGDETAFVAILERHYDRIFRVAANILGSNADAEDVTQEICMNLARKLKTFEGTARFTTWLHKVTINATRDHIRKKQTYAKATTSWGDWEISRVADNEHSRDQHKWLQHAMTQLKPDQRETVALVLGEELNHNEAAQALGVSEGTISWRMSQIKKSLAEIARKEGV